MEPDKDIKRSRIATEHLKSELILLFNEGKTSKQECLELIRTKFQIQKQRFYETYNVAFSYWSNLKEKTLKEGIQAGVEEAVKNGLKQKESHQREIEEEIVKLQQMLTDGYIVKEVRFKDGEIVKKKEIFGAYEYAIINRAIDQKRSELFKLEGMYAPTKNQIQGDKENPIPMKLTSEVEFDYSKLSTEDLMTLKTITEKSIIKNPNETSTS